MKNLQKFLAWNKERVRKNRVSLLTSAIVFLPTYLVASQFTSNYHDGVFLSFLIAIIIGISFGPLISYFITRPPKK
jgi:ABC-type Mn2+/Zn2+ transport system permease subunit